MTDQTGHIPEAPVISPAGVTQPVGAYDPRHVPAGTEITYTTVHDPEHPTITLRAVNLDDGYAYIDPRTAEAAAVLDGFGYPVARRILDERSAEAEAKAKADQRAARKAERDAATQGDA